MGTLLGSRYINSLVVFCYIYSTGFSAPDIAKLMELLSDYFEDMSTWQWVTGLGILIDFLPNEHLFPTSDLHVPLVHPLILYLLNLSERPTKSPSLVTLCDGCLWMEVRE